MPETRAFIGARGGGDRERRTPRAWPMRAIPSSTSRVVPTAAARSGGRIVRAVGGAYTAALGNWAPASRPVHDVGGVYPGGGTTGCGRKKRRIVTADLLSRARAGDGEAFRELNGPHRRELQVHCYRTLGSFADTEDLFV